MGPLLFSASLLPSVVEEMLMHKYYEFMAALGLVDKKQFSANVTEEEAIGQAGAAVDTSMEEQPSRNSGQSEETIKKGPFPTHSTSLGTKPDSRQLGEMACSLEQPSPAFVSHPTVGLHVQDDINTEGHEPRRSKRNRKPSSKYTWESFQS